MVVVTKKKGENVDTLLRRFSRVTKEENIAFEVSKRKFYLKPALLKKEKKKEKQRVQAQQKRRRTYR